MDNLKEMGVDKGKTKLSIGDNDNEIKKTLQASVDHCQLSGLPDGVFPMIVSYIQNYFSCYDSNRQGLLGAYNPKATFSLTVNMNNPAAYRPFKFDENFTKENRNLKRLVGNEEHHREKRYRLLHQGHIDTVSTICKLPATEHEPKSFKLDSCFFMPNLISFTLSGVFREGKPTDKVRPLRAFNRVFVCIPDANTQMSIINEQYTISNLTQDQFKLYYAEAQQQQQQQQQQATSSAAAAAVVNAAPVPLMQPAPVAAAAAAVGVNPVLLSMGLNEQQALMVTQFSAQTSLNLEWSKYCLEHSGWSYDQAGQTFISVKDNIPPEAYSK